MRERLQKTIARAGLASRREAESFIRDGMVTVNGVVITELGTQVDPHKDRINVRGKPITHIESRVYIMLNKPRGYITTLKDPYGRPIVTDLIKGVKQRIFPVGRLDYNTEGLLLLTNDGELTQRLLHPSNKVLKTYIFTIDGTLSSGEVKQLQSGVELSDGVTSPAQLNFIQKKRGKSLWKIGIYEGRKRQIRRMFEKIERPICRLKRIGFGPLELGELKTGRYRFLTTQEVRVLRRLSGPNVSINLSFGG
ncbi:MAG: pseudouridine synthase [Thermodesulfobacteriota bacterium]|nr:pseudouridine synthase [Thermodesulfobacteriota bacterium]